MPTVSAEVLGAEVAAADGIDEADGRVRPEGRHLPSSDDGEPGWVVCCHYSIRVRTWVARWGVARARNAGSVRPCAWLGSG